MPYLFATQDQDYSDFASGRVLYSQPGAPAFPVRLASEIFQRAWSRLALDRPLALYDPTCGGAYHLTALGFLHGGVIRQILASDAEARVLELARRNLGLLSAEGLARRKQEIEAMLDAFGKASHADALRSISTLETLREGHPAIPVRAFLANALDSAALAQAVSGIPIDLVICDIPYGQMTSWSLPENLPTGAQTPLWRMLQVLSGILSRHALVAVAADKRQKIQHEGYRRVERFQIGKRQVVFLKKVDQRMKGCPTGVCGQPIK